MLTLCERPNTRFYLSQLTFPLFCLLYVVLREHGSFLQPRAWCWAANSGWKWHNGLRVEDFAPIIADSELPFQLTVIADCDEGTVSVSRDGEGSTLLGGTFLYDGLKGKDLRLAVGTYDDACRVTILNHTVHTDSDSPHLLL